MKLIISIEFWIEIWIQIQMALDVLNTQLINIRLETKSGRIFQSIITAKYDRT